MKNHCMGNSTQNYAQIRNKAQTITCALPKLNTKSPYILNTAPTTALFFVYSLKFSFCKQLFCVSLSGLVAFVLFAFVLCDRRSLQLKYHAFSLLVSKFFQVFPFRSFVQFSIFGVPLSVRLYRTKTVWFVHDISVALNHDFV